MQCSTMIALIKASLTQREIALFLNVLNMNVYLKSYKQFLASKLFELITLINQLLQYIVNHIHLIHLRFLLKITPLLTL